MNKPKVSNWIDSRGGIDWLLTLYDHFRSFSALQLYFQYELSFKCSCHAINTYLKSYNIRTRIKCGTYETKLAELKGIDVIDPEHAEFLKESGDPIPCKELPYDQSTYNQLIEIALSKELFWHSVSNISAAKIFSQSFQGLTVTQI